LALALDRRASCRIERQADGVRLEATQALARAQGESLLDLVVPAALAPLQRALLAVGLAQGVRAVIQARVPPETGLAPDVAALVAAAAAALRLARAAEPTPEEVRRLAHEASGGGADALALETALRGGGVRLDAGGVHPLTIDPAWVEQSLVLVDIGEPARVSAPPTSAPAPALERELAHALAERDGAALPGLIARAWDDACRADPVLRTPRAAAALELARGLGGAGRPCAPAGGGLLLLWLPVAAQADATARLRQAGQRAHACRLDVLGLDVA
jgi:hypothetical protein